MKIAIIGATAHGIRTAEQFAALPNTHVDIFDSRPAPFGLTHYGASHPHVRFIGNVHIGRDISRDELDPLYDAVITANHSPINESNDVLDLIHTKGIPHTTWEQPTEKNPPLPRDWFATFRAAQEVPTWI
ncbi:hypothetical protein [Corynebacterium sp.]|uniref:hypothetical protein n=1 Tax=Corynebacterium sp. TaxID=1720 RepID=UPI0026DB607D|nr:hypothetical protein [Corynebacterium sp.]MDO5076783.1 hypothetical protein [Corynebacterium sp.]